MLDKNGLWLPGPFCNKLLEKMSDNDCCKNAQKFLVPFIRGFSKLFGSKFSSHFDSNLFLPFSLLVPIKKNSLWWFKSEGSKAKVFYFLSECPETKPYSIGWFSFLRSTFNLSRETKFEESCVSFFLQVGELKKSQDGKDCSANFSLHFYA